MVLRGMRVRERVIACKLHVSHMQHDVTLASITRSIIARQANFEHQWIRKSILHIVSYADMLVVPGLHNKHE